MIQKHYGTRGDSGRRRQAGASTFTSSLPSPLANDDEGDLAGTRELVRQSNDVALRGCVRGLATLLSTTASVAVDALGEDSEALHGALRSAADILWDVVRK